MSTATLGPIEVDASVRAFLKHHDAERAFLTVCELDRQCFPENRGIETKLRDDADEDGRRRVAVYVLLPAAHPDALLDAQVNRYHERFVEEVPLPKCPLFVLLNDFEAE